MSTTSVSASTGRPRGHADERQVRLLLVGQDVERHAARGLDLHDDAGAESAARRMGSVPMKVMRDAPSCRAVVA